MKKRRQAARFRGLGTGPLKTNKQARSASGSRGSGHHNNPARSPEPSPRAGPGRVALTFPMAWTQQAEQPGSVSRAPGLVPLSIPLCGPRSVALTAAAMASQWSPCPALGPARLRFVPEAPFPRKLSHISSPGMVQDELSSPSDAQLLAFPLPQLQRLVLPPMPGALHR